MDKPKTEIEALQYLNRHFGRGDIKEIRTTLSGERTFVRQILTGKFTSFRETRKYRVIGKTVYALGHQVTIA